MKLIKTLMRNPNVLSLAGQGLFAVLGFLSVVLLARAFTPEVYGLVVLYIAAATFMEMLRGGFLNTALVRFVAGSDEDTSKRYVGSSWVLGLIVTMVICSLVWSVYWIHPSWLESSGFIYFFKWYPLLAVAMLPFQFSQWILQAKSKFQFILLIKTVNMGLNIILFAWAFFKGMDVETLVIFHVLANALTSVVAMITGWSGVQHVGRWNKSEMKELANFGKFSMGTLIGTNLLKSSDTFIIGAVLGPAAAAIYSIPLKLTEVFEILLRSAVSVAIPVMSRNSMANRMDKVRDTFNQYTGVLTLVYIPLMAVCFVFAEDLIRLIGGDQYASAALIFRVLIIYGLFLPIDRFTGITLDCINRPKLNMVKVILMVVANVIGDLIVLQFTDGLWAVALVTISTVLVGVVFGVKFLKKDVPLNLVELLKAGWKNLSDIPAKGLSLMK